MFVEAINEGPLGITITTEQYAIEGLKGKDADNLYGIANKLGLDKRDFQGVKDAYEFDSVTEALLLPDGRVAVFGSDPLFADKANSRQGSPKQRVEVFSPPYLHRGDRPDLTPGGRTEVEHGSEVVLRTTDPTRISHVRLIRPESATHGTDFDQRSVALDITRRADCTLTVRVPDDASLVPPGWYMAVAVDEHGVPSPAVWVHVFR